MINSASEFVTLRTSEDPDEYHRAAWEEATEETWREVIRDHPEMAEWVAHNKSIPESIIRELYAIDDARVNDTLARKRRTPIDILEKLSESADESLRLAVAGHPEIPESLLIQLQSDSWQEVRNIVNERLSSDSK